jgi:protocatechuate 3,4-dioxygenase beta subunit
MRHYARGIIACLIPLAALDASASGRVERAAASIGGVVVDATSGEPIRRATVTALEQGVPGGPRIAVTNDEGRFVFRNLGAGRYIVTAVKAAYLATAYGATRLMSAGSTPTGTAIAVADGEQKSDVTLRLTRGGVITGVVRDGAGQPVRGAWVALVVHRRSPITGERGLSSAPGSATTDPRGEYRLFGLPPGEYIVVVNPSRTGFDVGVNDFEQTRAEDVRRLLDRSGSPGSTARTPPLPGQSAPEVSRRPTYGYAPVFFPGTTSLPDAIPVVIGAGEERAGIDLQLQVLPQSRLSGVVTGLDGNPAAGRYVFLRNSSPYSGQAGVSGVSTDSHGRYSIVGIPPGRYVVEAQPMEGRLPGGSGPPAWGRADVTIAAGEDATMNLALQPTLTVSGQLRVEGLPSSPPMDLTRVRIDLTSPMGAFASAVVTADGRFTITGLVPDAYRFFVSAPFATPWFVKSGTVAERDAAEQHVAIADDVRDASLVLTTQVSEVTGAIQDGAGRPAPEYFLVIFPADKSLWTWRSLRIQQTRPSSDGQFAFRNLPAGDYLLGAVTDLEALDLYEPQFLEGLFNVSVSIRLAEGEKKRQDIRVK